MGTFNTGLIYSQLTNELEGMLDLSKMSWIGKAAAIHGHDGGREVRY